MSATQTSRSPLALPVILLAQLVIPMSIAGTAVALPKVSAELGTVSWQLQWVVNGFNIAFAVMTLIWGSLADRVGHDRIFRAGISLALLGSVGSMMASSLILLDIARIIAGVGAAAVLTGAAAILSNAWSGAERTRAFAFFGTANGLGLALGPSVSGALVGLAGWRGVFAAQALILGISLLGSVVVPRVRRAAASNDGSKPVLLNLGLLKSPGFSAMLLVPIAGAIGFVTLLTYLPNAFSAIDGFSPDKAGALMLFATAPVFLLPMAVGAAMSRTKLRSSSVIVASFVLLGLGNVGLMTMSSSGSITPVIISMVLVGAGFGLPLGLVDAEALGEVPEEVSGSAAGLLNFARIGSEAAAVAVYAAVLTRIIGAELAGDPELAERVMAGQHAAPDVYAGALHVVVVMAAALVAILTAGFVLLRRLAASTNVRSNAVISPRDAQVEARS